VEILFNLISFLSLICAFNFAYAGFARFREVLSKNILKIEEITDAMHSVALAREVTDLNENEYREYLRYTDIKNACLYILAQRKYNALFETRYIEMFFTAGFFCAFHILWFTLYKTNENEELTLTVFSYSCLVILPILYVFLSGFTFPKQTKLLVSEINPIKNLAVILLIFGSGFLIYFLIKFFGYTPLYFNENACVFLSVILGILPYILFFVRSWIHIRNNNKAYNRCLELKKDNAEIDDELSSIFYQNFD